MMQGVRHMDEGEQILPFIRAFYGQPSTYSWEEDVGEVHIPKVQGGRRGFIRQLKNSKRAHLTAWALPNKTKKPREDTQ